MARLSLLVLAVVVCVAQLGSAAMVTKVLPRAVAHRGYSSAAPENTLAALKMSIEAGVDGVEIDLQVTKDGVIVLLHDEDLDRTTNCTGSISTYNFLPASGPPQLSECDAGSWFGPQFAGAKIPSLAEGLAVTVPAGVFMVLDMKQTGPGIGALLADVIPDPEVQGLTVASCWTFDQMAEVRNALNATRIQYLTGSLEAFEADPDAFFADMALRGVDGFSVSRKVITPEFVAAAKSHFMAVAVWTVNAAADMRIMFSYSVDAILTDYVTRLTTTLAEANAAEERASRSGYTKNSTVALASIFSFAAGALVCILVFIAIRLMRRRQRRAARSPRGVTSPTGGSYGMIP
ncbi:glycerophosphoryl diester phosphodiesterase [Thecamonas trahens ATCC 50062]|uniref:Glycerophosphoryl diester phosphodiesterase n=1 Tax=Thecamonas trahens ATCC 50062 TaxID=461836 RepID=A0A0L0DDC4_THETB|nr:glycerophosphoryl diester phosphodiesterase [Thecamonas trahens ATCC 50062]KNC50081.1 glycerophosphoryl diester phosphodiesterase [Thecamonas trahens ATCC 50062]|eukprot:XP_013757244.1 glycerophosphoryl diester phosphodiesterase [Thecamonas trahens ATCC 50062]